MVSTIQSPLWSTAYLVVVGFGTMLGMMFMTAAMSLPMLYAWTTAAPETLPHFVTLTFIPGPPRHAVSKASEKLEVVNESLARARFNTGTFLRIAASDRNLEEIRQFRQDIQSALSHAWTDDREEAESRFLMLRSLVTRLASQEPDAKRWRNLVLDVRQHADFIGREFDEHGNEVEVYRGGSGKSGGQRQKLATTCLAAALRYQLTDEAEELPVYAPVVLDEAFDKADNEFTALAMGIFVEFGFQMIVATPLKSVMTLEPFIGGACFIDIKDRKHSSVLLIEYDEAVRRLRLDLKEAPNAAVA